jgi:acetylornithine deacetylase/succinyl-diaminopimelate desuccinylase-like protein
LLIIKRIGGVRKMMDKTIKLCKELIEIRSNSGNELAAGNFVYKYLKGIGAKVKKQQVAKNRYNIIGRIKGEEPKLQVVTHLDTVPGHVPVKITSDKVFGRGAVDVKGQTACILSTLEGCERDVTLVFDVGEEVDFIGSEYATGLKELQQADLCLVTEPTDCRIAIAQKGIITFTVEIRGRAITTALAHKGINAISKAVELANNLQKHKLVNLVRINGGEADNIVPDKCDLTVNIRVPPKMDGDMLVNRLKRIIGKSGEFKLGIFKKPWNAKITKEIVWFKEMSDLEYMDFSAYTTAQYWSKYMPTVVFGPGDYTHAHSKHEFITIKELLKGKKIYERLWKV